MANEWIRKEYFGGTSTTQLNGAIGAGAMAITVVSGASYPDGSVGPFVISINRSTTEEKVLIQERVGNVLTVLQRGYDGTAALGHDDASSVDHVIDAYSLDQANALASAMGAEGSMAYRGVGLSFAELPAGTDGQVLVMSGGVPVWQDPPDTVPPGTILHTIGPTADTGYFFIDGSTVVNAQTLYAAMWARLPASWKSGADMTMPDWRGRVLFMDDAGVAFTLGGSGGANSITIASANLPVHTHAIDHDHGSVTSAAGSSHTHAIDHDHAAVTSAAGSSHTHAIDHDHGSVTSGAGSSHNHTQNAHSHLGSSAGNIGGSGSTQKVPGSAAGGTGAETPTNNAEAAHTHAVDLPNFTGTSGAEAAHTHSVDLPNFTGSSGAEAAHTHAVDLPNFTGTSGNGAFANTAIDTRPAYGVVNFQIKY